VILVRALHIALHADPSLESTRRSIDTVVAACEVFSAGPDLYRRAAL
jgi:hypothetical protein